MPEWQWISGTPARCREIVAVAQNAYFGVSWESQQGQLWSLWVFCTVAEAESLEGATVAECCV